MKQFIWGVVLTALFLSWGSEKYWTYYAVMSSGGQDQPYRGCDFDVYYGHETGTTPKAVEGMWFYSKLAGWEMSPLVWFSKRTSYIFWTSLMVGAYFLSVHKLLQVQDGWIIALLTLKPFTMSIIFGNIQPMLGLLCLTPLGMVLAVTIKSYCSGFLVLFAIKRCAARKTCRPYSPSPGRSGHDDLSRHHLDHHEAATE